MTGQAGRGQGRFITLEGGEGAGKSTQAARLAAWLESSGTSVLATREPGGSRRAEVLRELLLDGSVKGFGPDAEALVFALARADHLSQVIRPALGAGSWVICDRFIDSTWAYQGTAGVRPEDLARLDAIAVGATRPDLTFVLDLAAERGLERMRARADAPDRFEAEEIEVHRRRREAFLAIAAREPERCVVIDAGRGEDDVAAAIQAAVTERLGPPERRG